MKLDRAIKDGRTVSVLSVPLGAACGCVCPTCGEPVVAKNRDFEGRVTQKHFAHERNSDCAGRGGETAPETALHLLAKEIVEEGLQVMIPGLDIFPEAQQREFRQHFPAKRIRLRKAIKEPWRPAILSHQDMRPDVLGTTEKGQEIHIEFKVSHPVPPEKAEAALREQRWMLEIDLNRFRGRPVQVEELRAFIQKSVADRVWLSRAPGYDLKERLLRASDTPVECPLQLPRAIETQTCKSCPCRLTSPDMIMPREVRCTGGTCVTDMRTLLAWETGAELAVPSFAASILAAKRRKERAAEERKARIAELRRKILNLDQRRAGREADRARLSDLLLLVRQAEVRLKSEQRKLPVAVQEIESAAAGRFNRIKDQLRLVRSGIESATRRVAELREVEDAKLKERTFRQVVMTDYQNGKHPVLCPHCSAPAKGRFKDGQLFSIERCECLIPQCERTPSPTVWIRERSRRFLEERVRNL